jgi:hypothetical protein
MKEQSGGNNDDSKEIYISEAEPKYSLTCEELYS